MNSKTKKEIRKKERGFIALMAAIIISAILIGLSFAVSGSEFTARFGDLDHELKQSSVALSRSCGEYALLKIAQNYSYAPSSHGDIIHIGNQSCTIVSVLYGTEDTTDHQKSATIQTNAQDNSVWSSVIIQATVLNPSFTHLPGQENIVISSFREATSTY